MEKQEIKFSFVRMSTITEVSHDITDPSNLHLQEPIALQVVGQAASASQNSEAKSIKVQGVDENNGPFAEVVTAQEAWNDPKINIWRVSAAFLGFMVLGANDACYGPLIPSLESDFKLSYAVVSLIFLSPFIGYVLAAFLSDKVHMLFGQRGVALIGPGCRLLSYVVLSVHPPYPVVLVFLVGAGFGNGLLDASWNAFVGDLKDANQLLGIIHGFYGLGASLSPIVATTMVTKYELQWNTFFFVMVGLALIDLALSTFAFWGATGAEFRKYSASSNAAGGRMRAVFKNKVTWICSLFLLSYVGSEGLYPLFSYFLFAFADKARLAVSIGGWLVVFMLRVRDAAPFASGMTVTGFWLGITVGRVVLGFVTPRFGERTSVTAYLLFAMALELVFWLVPQFYVSAVAVGLLGFFLGPLFPAVVVAATKILPKRMHVGSIGFSTAVGGSGAAV